MIEYVELVAPYAVGMAEGEGFGHALDTQGLEVEGTRSGSVMAAF